MIMTRSGEKLKSTDRINVAQDIVLPVIEKGT